jgi:hypothetical protein
MDPNSLGITQPQFEGLQDDYLHYTQPTIPEYIIPVRDRSKHHILDIRQAIGFYMDPDGRLQIDKTSRVSDFYKLSNANTPPTETSKKPSPTYTNYTNHAKTPLNNTTH